MRQAQQRGMKTYSCNIDIDVLTPLASFGATAHKIATDLRLLAHLKVTHPYMNILARLLVQVSDKLTHNRAGSRGAVRVDADWVLGDGGQAEPDAL